MTHVVPNILLNNMRMRGNRQGIKQAKGKENRAQRGARPKSTTAITEKPRVTERSRAYVTDDEVHTRKRKKAPIYD